MKYKVITDLAYTYIGLVTTMTKHYVSEGVPLIFNSSIKKEGIDVSKPVFLDIEFAEKNKNRKHKKNDVVTVHTGDIGVSAVISDDLDGSLGFATIVTRINDHDVLLPEYLCAFLNYGGGKEQLYKYSRDARNNLNLADYNRLIVPLPSINKQYEIIELEKKLKNIIDYRKQQLQQLDNLVKARFVELFGEVETNVKGFTMKRMDECCKFIGGAQPDKSHFEYKKTDDNIRLIQIRDYKSDRFITYIPKSLARKTCTASDIMIGRYGPPIFQILGGIEGAYNVALMKAVPTDEFNTEYFRYFLKSEKLLHYLESFSQRTAGQDGIQIDKLNAYPCFVPPIELQNEFANFVKQIDKSKFKIQQSLEKLEILKKSLMQQYFG